jgi:hypothetical protein
MASGVHLSLCDYVVGVGSLQDMLVVVCLLCVLMVDHSVMVVTQKSQHPIVKKVTECGSVPWLFLGTSPIAAVCLVTALTLTTALVAALDICHQATA